MLFMDLSAELGFAVIAIGAALAAISLNEQRRDPNVPLETPRKERSLPRVSSLGCSGASREACLCRNFVKR